MPINYQCMGYLKCRHEFYFLYKENSLRPHRSILVLHFCSIKGAFAVLVAGVGGSCHPVHERKDLTEALPFAGIDGQVQALCSGLAS